MIRRHREGDVEGARELDHELEPVVRAAEGRAEPDGDQGRAGPAGFDVGGLRLPLVEATDDEKADPIRPERPGSWQPVASGSLSSA